MTVSRVAVVSVPVSDPERARRFFVDQLGFTLLRDDASVPGMRWISVAPPDGGTALTLVTWFESMPAGSLRGLVLSMSDLDSEYLRLSEAGVPFDETPRRRPWGYEAVICDPDGNQFVLQES